MNTREHFMRVTLLWPGQFIGLSCVGCVLLWLQTDSQIPVVQGDQCTAAAAFVLIMPSGKKWEMLLFSFSVSLLKDVCCIFRSILSLSRMPLEFSCNHVHLHTKPGGGGTQTDRQSLSLSLSPPLSHTHTHREGGRLNWKNDVIGVLSRLLSSLWTSLKNGTNFPLNNRFCIS